jgi:hypothetical protein
MIADFRLEDALREGLTLSQFQTLVKFSQLGRWREGYTRGNQAVFKMRDFQSYETPKVKLKSMMI